ncbi:MAG: thioredoxin family protein [Candidatus Paracaedibacteraceae bacterium]|nr:thioredoxin family protein [Candidatus Paracaedibacteraceae bacterium]
MIEKNRLKGLVFVMIAGGFSSLAMCGDKDVQDFKMSQSFLESKPQLLSFSLEDVVTGKAVSLSSFPESTKATVVVFMCNHCPSVIHILDKLIETANIYIPLGIRFIGISSNDIEGYPEDGPDKMKELAIKKNFPFSYVFDETQEVARAYEAKCTPDVFVLNRDFEIYRGRFDGTKPGSGNISTGEDLKLVLDCILKNEPLPEPKESMGCTIKWKLK